MKVHCYKKKIMKKLKNKKGLMFHLAGMACIIWFIIRVLPKPDRIRYPCQQMGISVAFGYIAFWTVLWTAMFQGLRIWMKKAKLRTSKISPIVLVGFVLIFTISSNVFANNYVESKDEELYASWNPIADSPMGTPKGVNPGRVVWTWDPSATSDEMIGKWWNAENINLPVIEQMFSDGICALAGQEDDFIAWNQIFRYFNQEHGKGDIGYQPGEKIAIKINMNNIYYNDYDYESNRADANPYVVKALLRQLINNVGVAQEDIIVFDASRRLVDWFYNRAFYEEYPADPLVPEFPNVNFVDLEGGASGRQKVIEGSSKVYFSEGSCEFRTLPTIVEDADYLINMPLFKRHPLINGVTLSGKNLYGAWIEPVANIHNYHFTGQILGNPAPQVELLAHEHLGAKTLVYIADGLFGCRSDHEKITRFYMYPFNKDWTSSLFFSQDPIAIDSVMYDFLYTEGEEESTEGQRVSPPTEGSQNYLHQGAEPNENTYDPEGDGSYLDYSIGVHEHWDSSIDIFSSERYSGQTGNGIDFVAVAGTPSVPEIIGPNSGKPGTDYEFSIVSSDPNGDDIYYWIKCEGNDEIVWDGPYSSGEEVKYSFTWNDKGTFTILVKAKDTNDLESSWGSLEISVPRAKIFTFSFFARILERFPNTFQLLRYLIN